MQTLADPQGGSNPRAQSIENAPPEQGDAIDASWAVQAPLAGLPGGVQWDLFPAKFIAQVAVEHVEETRPRVDEIDAVYAELQQGLRFDGTRPEYEVPDLSAIAELPIEARAYCEHPPEHARVETMDSAELADRLNWLFLHRGRALSSLDRAIQREWCARALGYGYFYARQQPWLPVQLVELVGGERAFKRRIVFAALCQALVKRANGIHISAPEAESLWGISESTWWAVIAWLEARGLLVRLRQFKNTPKREKGQSPVQLDANWYGPGPVLLQHRTRVLAAYGDKRAAEEDRAREHERLIELRRFRRRARRRRDRERERRRRGETIERPGQDAPEWLLFAASLAYEAHAEQVLAAHAAERAAALLEGRRSWAEISEDAAATIPMPGPSALGLELERLAVSQVIPDPAMFQHQARLARLELADEVACEASVTSERRPCVPTTTTELSSSFFSDASGLSHAQPIALQSTEGAPAELENKTERNAPQARSAGCRVQTQPSNEPPSARPPPDPTDFNSPLPTQSLSGATTRRQDEVASHIPAPPTDEPYPSDGARTVSWQQDREAAGRKSWDQLVAELRRAVVVDSS